MVRLRGFSAINATRPGPGAEEQHGETAEALESRIQEGFESALIHAKQGARDEAEVRGPCGMERAVAPEV